MIKVINIWVPPTKDRIQRLTQQQTSTPAVFRVSNHNDVLINQVQSLVAAVQLQATQIDDLKHEIDTLRQSQQVPQMVNAKTIAAAGANCTTAFDCWTEALQRLQAAERMVDDALNQTRVAEDKWIAANSTFALKTAVETNTNNIDTNTQDIATNTQGVANNNDGWTGLESTVSGLSVGLCNVQQIDVANNGVPAGFVMIVPAHCTFNAPCDSNWITYGQFDGGLTTFGQPCLNGDGSYERFLNRSVPSGSCKAQKNSCPATMKNQVTLTNEILNN